MGDIENNISFALRQHNIVVVDNEEDRRKEGCALAVPVIKEFCKSELEIESPETPVFDFSKTEDLERWADTLSEYYGKFCKERQYLLNGFQDYIVALNDDGVFPVMHNFDAFGIWNDKLREFYGYQNQLPSRFGKKYILPRAVATVSKDSWRKRKDYNGKIRCCWNKLEYGKEWEMVI